MSINSASEGNGAKADVCVPHSVEDVQKRAREDKRSGKINQDDFNSISKFLENGDTNGDELIDGNEFRAYKNLTEKARKFFNPIFRPFGCIVDVKKVET